MILPDGYTYEKSAIQDWFNKGSHTSPMTQVPIDVNCDLIPNRALRESIDGFLTENPQLKVKQFQLDLKEKRSPSPAKK